MDVSCCRPLVGLEEQYPVKLYKGNVLLIPKTHRIILMEHDHQTLSIGRAPDQTCILCVSHYWDQWIEQLQAEHPELLTRPDADTYLDFIATKPIPKSGKITLPYLAVAHLGMENTQQLVCHGKDYLIKVYPMPVSMKDAI